MLRLKWESEARGRFRLRLQPCVFDEFHAKRMGRSQTKVVLGRLSKCFGEAGTKVLHIYSLANEIGLMYSKRQ